MLCQHLFHPARRQPVAGDVDDVVGAGHDVDIAVLVHVAGVRGRVVAGKLLQVGRLVALVIVVERRQGSRGQRQLDADGADLAPLHLLAGLVEHPHVPAWHRHGRRSRLHRQLLQTHAVRGDRPAGLGLPPVVDDRTVQRPHRPVQGVGVGAFAGEEQVLERRQVVLAHLERVRVLALDGAERGRRGEQHLDLVVGDHPPEGPGIGRAHRLAFVDDRRAAVKQRGVDDIGMADDPADIRGRPVHIAGLDVVDVLHGPLERHQMAAIVADHALRLAGGAGGVEDVERIGRGDGHAIGGRGARHCLRPVDVVAGLQVARPLRALQHDGRRRLGFGQLDGAVEQRLVGDDLVAFDAA